MQTVAAVRSSFLFALFFCLLTFLLLLLLLFAHLFFCLLFAEEDLRASARAVSAQLVLDSASAAQTFRDAATVVLPLHVLLAALMGVDARAVGARLGVLLLEDLPHILACRAEREESVAKLLLVAPCAIRIVSSDAGSEGEHRAWIESAIRAVEPSSSSEPTAAERGAPHARDRARGDALAGEFSFIYRYILRESCSQFYSLPLTSLTISSAAHVRCRAIDAAARPPPRLALRPRRRRSAHALRRRRDGGEAARAPRGAPAVVARPVRRGVGRNAGPFFIKFSLCLLVYSFVCS